MKPYARAPITYPFRPAIRPPVLRAPGAAFALGFSLGMFVASVAWCWLTWNVR